MEEHKMKDELQKQMHMINDLYVSSSSSGRLFAMKQVVRIYRRL